MLPPTMVHPSLIWQRIIVLGANLFTSVLTATARAQSLQEAHDIGESLQQKVESLDDVERAFVHLDFETSHDPSTEHKQWGTQAFSSD